MLKNIKYELELFKKFGYTKIAGVDEVGRGALAGPFVVCAVILDLPKLFSHFKLISDKMDVVAHINNDVSNADTPSASEWKKNTINSYAKITDSKKLSAKTREILHNFLIMEAFSYKIVEISNTRLDKLGISQTTQIAFSAAVSGLKIKPKHVLTDQFPLKTWPKVHQTNITKGDLNSITIGSASIIAKVYRDRLMIKMASRYPQYGFDNNKGYGTAAHLERLNEFGPSDLHRKTFNPVSLYN